MAPSLEDLALRQQDLFTRIANALENLKKRGKSALTGGNVEARIQLLDGHWAKFVQYHEQICSLGMDAIGGSSYIKTDLFGNAEEAYAAQKGALLDLLNEIKLRATPTSLTDSSTSRSELRPRAALPRISLPQFSGRYEDWTAFRDLFQSLILNEPTLSDVERLHYLKTSLSGEAATLVKNLPTTGANFERAWEVLQTRYENRRLLVGAQIGALSSIRAMTRESTSELKRVLDSTCDAVAALETLGCPITNGTYWLVHLTANRLDPRSRRDWETSLEDQTQPPQFDELRTFLENRVRALESIAQAQPPSTANAASSPVKATSSAKSAKAHHAAAPEKAAGRCSLCQRNHYLLFCSAYQAKTPTQRKAFVESAGLCINCLGRHGVRECRSSKTCMKCALRHHSSLHEASVVPLPDASTSALSNRTDSASPSVKPGTSTSHWAQACDLSTKTVLLATARVIVVGDNGATTTVRALVDPCSEVSLISEALAQRLRLSRQPASLPVVGVGSRSSTTTRGKVTCTVMSRSCDSQRLQVSAFVLPRLSSYRPRCSAPAPSWDHLEGLFLADPAFTSSEVIDLLLGADVYPAILQPGVRKGPANSPAAQETIFGWILSGSVSLTSAEAPEVTTHQCSVDMFLCQQVQRFWEQEEVASEAPSLTADERFCEAHYQATHYRQPDGRYVVALPLKRPPTDLGESRRSAGRTLHSMERRFVRDAPFGELYRGFMAEYESLGHMTPCRRDTPPRHPVYYLPHHGVRKDGGSIRVVFNGSAPSSTGVSLNAIQHVGPKLLQDLPVLLLRWRMHACVVVADIEKMYRQIRVQEGDWDLQRILWRSSPDHELLEYHLTTVTYGQACAPFLAIRTLKQLAHDEKSQFPLGAQALSSDVYVDDILSGASTPTETIQLAEELLGLCRAGGFPLRKWASNSQEVLSSLPGSLVDSVHLEWPELAGRSVLGLEWRPSRDDFFYRLHPVEDTPVVTKRRVLSLASRLFDPLGWLAPVTIRAKTFLQSLWLLRIGWDDPLPDREIIAWTSFRHDLAHVGSVTVPRWLGHRPSLAASELLGFSDASERAYAAVVYLRCENGGKEPSVRLVTAKTKVAPLKSMALPRLELCGAVLLVRLLRFVRVALSWHDVPARLFTDSTVVLGWIRAHPSRWKTFVANRVSEIQTSEPSAIWGHVVSRDNPADCASRGIEASRLAYHSLWWQGPSWATNGSAPAPPVETDSAELDIEERCSAHVATVEKEQENPLLLRFSSLHRLLRVTAWCMRWRLRCSPSAITKAVNPEPEGLLQAAELRAAQVRWVNLVQAHHFREETAALAREGPLPSRSALLRLNPFIDEEGQLRVGGRLKNAVLTFDELHPVILPRESHFTILIAEAAHRRTLHGGVQLTLATLRRSFWIIQGRRVVKAIVHRCLTCIRWRASTPHQLMAPLPPSRVRPARPFSCAGIDYAGPIFMRTAPGRGHKAYKGYIAVFICMATRAVHLEAVSAYSTDAFLAAYRRFAARRGPAAVLYSDCGTTFTGADAELRAMFRASSVASKEIAAILANDGTTWRFNPPSAPHFGGIWEAAVKSTKHHLRRVIGESTLTFEEMSTFLAQVEACLNSRPLQQLSDDPDDLAALTPAHFLVGTALTAVPEPSLVDVSLPRLSRWQLVQQMLQSFWRRWSTEYLTTLQGRAKWTRTQPDVRIGQLCFLRQDPLPPTKWPLARITGIHPGADGHVRVVTVRTAASPSLTRPITKLVPLPSAD